MTRTLELPGPRGKESDRGNKVWRGIAGIIILRIMSSLDMRTLQPKNVVL